MRVAPACGARGTSFQRPGNVTPRVSNFYYRASKAEDLFVLSLSILLLPISSTRRQRLELAESNEVAISKEDRFKGERVAPVFR